MKKGGDAVVIANTPEGDTSQAHYVLGRFGTSLGGPMWKKSDPFVKARRVFFLSYFPSRVAADRFGTRHKVVCVRSWDEVREELCSVYGPKAKVAVYPYTALQYPSEAEYETTSEDRLI